jgi:cytochrome c5
MAAHVSWPTIGLPVSKHDTHFFNTFSMIIGGLIVVALLIFALARVVAGHTQEPEVYADAQYVASVDERIKPFAREAVAGADNAALAIQAGPQAASIVLEVPKDGPSLYEAVCKTCHAAGLVGAHKFGDHVAWAPRIAKGKATLYEHALKGFNAMPAKGSRTDLSDELIKAGVDYLVQKGG